MSDDQDQAICVFVTVPDAAVAQTIARALVEERLVACVNDTGPVTSVYRWKGQVETETERLLMMKTRRARFAELERRVRALHPYEVPEVIALPIAAGSDAYLRWIGEQTG